MKILLPAFLCLISFSAFSQTKKYTVLFGKDGKLESPDYPTILHHAELTIDLSKTDIPKSKLIARFEEFLKVTSDTTHPFYNDFHWERKYMRSLIDSYDSSYVIGYDNWFNRYFPVLLNPAAAFKKLIWKKSSGDSVVVSGKLEIDGDEISKVEYNITIDDPDNQLVARHLAGTARLFKGIGASHLNYIRDVRKDVRNEANAIGNAFLIDSLDGRNFNLGLVERLKLFESQKNRIEGIYNHVLKENRDWIKSWIWYSRGKIVLNPFEVTSDTILVVNRWEEQIHELSEELKLWNTILREDPTKFAEVNHHISSISNRLSDLKTIPVNGGNLGSQYRAWMKQSSFKNKILYSGVWHVSSESAIQWMRHYDFDLDFADVSKAKSLPDMIASRDRMAVYVHNLKEGDKVRNVSTAAAFQPKSPLQITLEEIETQFTDAAKQAEKLAGIIPHGAFSMDGLLNFNQGLHWSQPASGLFDLSIPCDSALKQVLENIRFGSEDNYAMLGLLLFGCPDSIDIDGLVSLMEMQDRFQFMSQIYNLFHVEPLAEYRALMNEMRLTRSHMEWLLNQTTPPLKISLEDDETADFRTEVLMPEEKLDIAASSKVTYSVYHNSETEAELTKTYKKYHTAFFLPTIGLAYIPGDRTGSVFDPGTKQFMPGKRFDNIEAFAGVKFYPFKTNPVRKVSTTRLIRKNVSMHANFKRGNHFASKLFVTAGLGVKHQFLRNYYGGVGIDLIPGVNFHVGSNLILRKYYQLENAEIKREQQRPTGYLYFSFGFDPGIVASLTNIFIK
ncbi:hypothetical protein SAMN05216327_101279 [Dyadobacter sp. SG02]|nr:hypothetical protein SAMN05216327_101279 [Dyadobacter sp. SG02]